MASGGQQDALSVTTETAPPSSSVAVGIVGGGLVLGVTALSIVSEIALLALSALLALVVLTPAAPWLVLVFTALVLGLAVPLSDYPLDYGFLKLYGADFVIVVLAWAGFYRLLRLIRPAEAREIRSVQERRLVRILIVLSGYGLVSLAAGLFIKHYEIDEVLGAYRRLFFYSLAFVVPLWVPLAERHLRRLKYVVLVAGTLVIGLGLYRVATGNPVHEEVNFATSHTGVRMLAVSEYLCVALLLAYLTATFLITGHPVRKVVAVLLAGAGAGMMLFSGYRLGIVFMVAAPALGSVLAVWISGEGITRLARTALTAGAIAVPVVVLAVAVFPQQMAKTSYDMRVRAMDTDVTGDYRRWIWSEAMNELSRNPVLGAGLGHELVFSNRTREGVFERRKASTHSTFVAVSYQTGVVGAGLYLAFHGLFALYFFRRARDLMPGYRAVLVGLFSGYLCMMGGSFLEPLRVAGYVGIHLVMGFIVRLLRETRRESAVSSEPFSAAAQ